MIRHLFLSLSLGLSMAMAAGSQLAPAYSQTQDPSFNDPSDRNERDAFSSGLGEGFSPFDLIHRSNLGGGLSIEEYRQRQQENLDHAADDFRQQQQQLLQEQNQEAKETSPQP